MFHRGARTARTGGCFDVGPLYVMHAASRQNQGGEAAWELTGAAVPRMKNAVYLRD